MTLFFPKSLKEFYVKYGVNMMLDIVLMEGIFCICD